MKWGETHRDSASHNPSLTVRIIFTFGGHFLSFLHHFFFTYLIGFGDVVVQEFLLSEDGTVQVVAAAFNPVDPGDTPDISLFSCVLGDGVTFSAPAYNR